jgi:septal ring factor EnvC (AmiA/AmiB activator)
MAGRWWQQVEGSKITRSKTQNSNDGRDFTMMQIEEPKPLLSSFEILARQNRDSHLKSVLDQPGALKIPGLESLETMQSQIAELQSKYEAEAARLASEQATLESLNGRLSDERRKLSHGEFLYTGSKAAVDSLVQSIYQCLTQSEQSKLQTALILRAGNSQYVEVWPTVKKMVQSEVKRLEAEISKLTKGENE